MTVGPRIVVAAKYGRAMTSDPMAVSVPEFAVPVTGGVTLAGERRGRPGAPAVVFLHAGVADRRAWGAVLDALRDDDLDLIAYDRRGYGETPIGADDARFTHLADLIAVLDAAGVERAVVVGNSMGGELALDIAATAPQRVAAVLLLGAGVSGMTDEDTPFDWVPDAASEPLMDGIAQAHGAGDVDEEVRLLLHLWLDGPASDEGRVGGPARQLAVTMNRRILEIAAPEGAGSSGLDTWAHLDTVTVPVLATWGDLDISADQPFYAETARRLPSVTSRVLTGTAHLPSLEAPELVADLVRETIALGG